jgi:prolyl 4-hydroxylase
VSSEAELEEKARGGDARAQFALGRLLLDGPRAAREGPRAVDLIEKAAAAGIGDATAMTALFEAMGITRPPDWNRALDCLQLAAEQGSASARLQLGVLARESKGRPRAGPRTGSSWSGLRSRIDLAAIFRSGERKTLNERPPVYVIEQFASAAECRWLIERARERMNRATVISPATGGHMLNIGRTNRSTGFQLPDMDLVIEIVRTRISAATGLPLPFFEPTQLLHYARGQEFRPHFDFFDNTNAAYRDELRRGQRVVTFLLYLNHGFVGGETDFPDAGFKFKPGTGGAVFWPNVNPQGQPEPLTRHSGLPPTSGEKWILSQWIRGPAGRTP